MESTSRIVCCGDDAAAAEALAALLRDLFPAVVCEGTTWPLLGETESIVCLVAIIGVEGEKTLDGILGWRARGYECPIVVVAEDRRAIDRDTLATTGVHAVIRQNEVSLQLLPAVESALDERRRFTSIHQRLHHLRALLAAGRLASRLPHRLNNPLAALLGEAELLTLEPLTEDQRESVGRIIELGRRIVTEVKVLDGVIGDTPRP